MHSNASGWDTSFVLKQLKDSFAKLKISDNSIDKAAIEAQITEYFMEKFQSLITYDWKYDFIDLFCGAGGLSVGFEQEGFRPVVAVDNNEAAVRTYRLIVPGLQQITSSTKISVILSGNLFSLMYLSLLAAHLVRASAL